MRAKQIRLYRQNGAFRNPRWLRSGRLLSGSCGSSSGSRRALLSPGPRAERPENVISE